MRTWHILTGEYPPEAGGVAAYTETVAAALAAAGDRVHVWTSGTSGRTDGAVSVHRVFGAFDRAGIAAGGACLDACAPGGRILVQWVPHAFGGRGMNLRFAAWLHDRTVRRPEPVDVMVHEPFVPFARSATQAVLAAAQRAMTALVVRTASRAFVGTPAWAALCRPFAPGVAFRWMPIPSGVPVVPAEPVQTAGPDPVVGCFGRGGEFQVSALRALGTALALRGTPATILLVGTGSHAIAARLRAESPSLAAMVRATGTVASQIASSALRACDVMVQPYADGVCTRHSSMSAVLAHGLPAVTTSGRFTEPLWSHSGAVRLHPAGDLAGFASTVLDVLASGAERRRLAAAAAALYDAHFHVRHTVEALHG